MSSEYDAIVVLGGGVKEDRSLPPHVLSRLDLAEEMYTKGLAPLILLSGKGWSKGVTEAFAMKDELVSRGIHRRCILMEELSMDTIGNAWFTRVLHADPSAWKKLAVVTSEFHLERSKFVFKWAFGSEYIIEYFGSSDNSIDSRLLSERCGIEAFWSDFFKREVMSRFECGNRKEIHRYIFSSHPCYTEDENELTEIHNKASADIVNTGALY